MGTRASAGGRVVPVRVVTGAATGSFVGLDGLRRRRRRSPFVRHRFIGHDGR